MIYWVLLHTPVLRGQSSHIGRGLLKYALMKEHNIGLKDEHYIYTHWGKPVLAESPDIHFSISYSHKRAVCIVSKWCVGIDIEKVRPFNGFAAVHAFSDSERIAVENSKNPDREFFRIWTLKESYIKAIGKGLAFPMKNAVFHVGDCGEVQSNVGDCYFVVLEDEHEYITSICYRTHSKGTAIGGKLYQV